MERGHVLESFIKQWEDYTLVAKMVNRIFYYLDRYYLKEGNRKKTGAVALDLFFSAMTQSAKEKIRDAI